MVTPDVLETARQVLGQLTRNGPVHIIVVPDSVGLGDNPAITIKKSLHLSMYRSQLQTDNVTKYVDKKLLEGGEWKRIVDSMALNTILVQEGMVVSRDQTLRAAVIWHEYGHVLHGAAESGNVYLHEIESLWAACKALGEENVRRVIQDRVPQYRKAVDPGKEALAKKLGELGISL